MYLRALILYVILCLNVSVSVTIIYQFVAHVLLVWRACIFNIYFWPIRVLLLWVQSRRYSLKEGQVMGIDMLCLGLGI